MRVSTINLNNIMLKGMQNSQDRLAVTINQISTGKQILQPSDDAVNTVKLLQMNNELNALNQYENNIDSARAVLQQQDVLYSGMNDLLTKARDIVLQASNDTLNDLNREALATDLEFTNSSLVSLANYQLADGQYLFAGTASTQKPVIESGGDYSYQGNNGQRRVSISGSAQVAVNESSDNLFFDAGAIPADSIFDVMTLVVDELKNPTGSTVLSDALGRIDSVIDNVGFAQTTAGNYLSQLDRVSESHADLKLMLQSLQSSLENVDMAEAATVLAQQQTVLSASQQVYANIQQLSLFNYF